MLKAKWSRTTVFDMGLHPPCLSQSAPHFQGIREDDARTPCKQIEACSSVVFQFNHA